MRSKSGVYWPTSTNLASHSCRWVSLLGPKAWCLLQYWITFDRVSVEVSGKGKGSYLGQPALTSVAMVLDSEMIANSSIWNTLLSELLRLSIIFVEKEKAVEEAEEYMGGWNSVGNEEET